ncbi:16S rRNA (uracil(1498)-N(3))-methyltransferase [Homoserinimonas hongtaonis]|uniref:16S rRNA (uracil(1498)-N(3))-methyltransferase n=1 Tax=Homoserinimonas hongtaonis TaxID=2079791 RepID=UPI000D343519|nr:16S rRNA (uracil(1498)-N(3))-methyltransferase [Salinibacterium hongtaonis]AWB89406.1 16S rRNA (uracil(1498)-N(3))-methyltransferase [Salinibacterium hongtaonis]
MAHFYLAESLASASVGATVSVTGAEAKHAVSVSRIRVGESLSIGNGAGLVVTGEVTEARPDLLSVVAQTVTQFPRPTPALVLAQALAKGGRDESAVQSATELGVDTVIPWAAQRSIVRWDAAKASKGRERWHSIVREASKQSMRPWVPAVGEVATTKQLAARGGSALILVLEPTAEKRLTELSRDELERHDEVVLVVGPEGGVADGELSSLRDAGAVLVKLGDGILRTSTAGPAAIAVLNAQLGRW